MPSVTSGRTGVRRRLLQASFLLGLCAMQVPAARAESPIPVFVSILPQKHVVSQIGGDRLAVSVMVGPGQSPATYEPTARQLVALSRAQLYFSIGVAFEDAWLKRIQAANPALRIVPMQRGVAPLPLTRAQGQGSGADPHVWTSPKRMKIMAATVREALIEATPASQPVIDANFGKVMAELDALDSKLQLILAPVKGKPFLVFHPAWGYFAHDYGLRQIPIEAEGKEPGARSLARVIERGRREGVSVVFVQAQFSRRTAETVAAAIGARIVVVDPLAEDYARNLLQVAQEFAAALQ